MCQRSTLKMSCKCNLAALLPNTHFIPILPHLALCRLHPLISPLLTQHSRALSPNCTEAPIHSPNADIDPSYNGQPLYVLTDKEAGLFFKSIDSQAHFNKWLLVFLSISLRSDLSSPLCLKTLCLWMTP